MTTATITDDFMKQMLATSRMYTIVLLKTGPNANRADAHPLTWEHARKNFQLRAEGKLAIVCPIMDHAEFKGVGIFNTDASETKKIMDADPGVTAGLFTYEICTGRSFPGDKLV